MIAGVGYFESLSRPLLLRLTNTLAEINDQLTTYFTVSQDVQRVSVAEYHFGSITENETFESDRYDVGALAEFVEVFATQKWLNGWVMVQHGALTGNLKLQHIGAYKNELIRVAFDSETGICEMQARFRERTLSQEFLLRVAKDLELSEKPVKASRYIPEDLEIKLLCDSMHLCNVCREPGVIVHHVIPVEEGGPSNEENLIVLCPNHHNQAHSKTILVKTLRPQHLLEYKQRHLRWVLLRGSNMAIEQIVDSED
jgi:HNH endonuclease